MGVEEDMNLLLLLRAVMNGVLLFIFVTITVFHANCKEGRMQYIYSTLFVVIMLFLSKSGGVRWR